MSKSVIGQRNWDIVNLFKGYRNREDPTNLAPGIMVYPSRNVLTNLSDRIGPTPGYTLFGQANNALFPVLGSFDLLDVPTTITERHLKTWGTHVQVLWEGYDETSTPKWNDLYTSSTSPYYNFTQFWEGDIQKLWTLGVNNTTDLFAWNNAMAGYLSSTSNTLTKQGTTTWEEEGFDPYANYTASIVFTAKSETDGIIVTLEVLSNEGGDGYEIGDILSIVGGDNTATAIVSSIVPDSITLDVASSSGYIVGNNVTGGTSGATGKIATIGSGYITITNFNNTPWFGGETITGVGGGSSTLTNWFVTGVVNGVILKTAGTGYVASTNVRTTGGTGTGCTVTISAITDLLVPATMSDVTNGFLTNNFQLGQTIVISGTSANDGTYVIADINSGVITIAQGQNFTSETDGSTTIVSTPSLLINGLTYTYTGGLASTTLTGVSGPITATVGDMVAQKPQIFPFSYFYGFPTIGITAQAITSDASQLYLGSSQSNIGYISNIDNFFNYTFGTTSALARLAGEGGQFNCDATIKGLINLDGNIFATTGQNEWCMVVFNNGQVTVGTAVVYTQSIDVQKIKTTTLQGAISQGAITAVENNLVFLSFSNQSLILGKTQFQDGQQTTFYNSDVMTQLSAPVIYDFDSFDFTDATIYYDDSMKYVLHSFPKSSTYMIYNSNADQSYWEAPQSGNVGKFATIHGELYAHGYLTPETYKWFTGLNNNGGAISCLALFSFQNFGYRVNQKHDTGHFLEGYTATNTTINFGWNFEQSGCGSSSIDSLVGTDTQWVCGSNGGGSWLGSSSLGKFGLGSAFFSATGNQDLPPAFNIISTLQTPKDFRQAQFFISSNGVDFDWQLVAYGMEVTVSDKINVRITR